MSGPYQANIVNLSSGQILFADPTKPWSPDNFPNLPSTTLALGVAGRIEDGNFRGLTFTNTIGYAAFEPLDIRSSLTKTLQIASDGTVTYTEPTVAYVSTLLQSQSTSIRGFASPAIGAPGIQGYTDASPDTVTNALAKLDAWIANAFLVQPPAVQPVAAETNAFYGGVRWTNFRTFSALDKSFPYVDSIVFIIGDPESGNYCTIELGDSDYFPYKNYVDGLSPPTAKTPLVRLRIYTDIFVQSANSLYTKAAMQGGCVRLLSEAGHLTVPSQGKVFALEDTDGSSFYTTVSIYLPNLPNAYPKGTPVPVRILYMNSTDSAVNVAVTSTVQATSGGPSAVSSVTYQYGSPSTATLQLTRPVYSDALAEITTPYFSTYTTTYRLQQMQTAHQSGVGFVYGTPSATQLPAHLTPTYASTLSTQAAYTASIQNMSMAGLAPGAVWSTTAFATNAARIAGVETAGPLISTLYPSNPVSTLAHMPLVGAGANVRSAGLLYTPVYNAALGWTPSTPVAADVLFLSTVAHMCAVTPTAIQWNDASYPGDRSTIRLSAVYDGTDAVAFSTSAAATNSLSTNRLLSTSGSGGELYVTLDDVHTESTSQYFFYKAHVSTLVPVSTLSAVTPHTLACTLENRVITGGYTGTIAAQTLSSLVYRFYSEPCDAAATTDVVYCGVTNVRPICGMYTPTPSSDFLIDVYGSNFAHAYSLSTVATAQTRLGSNSAGPETLVSTVRVFSGAGATELTTLPFPRNTTLRLSSVVVRVGSNVWQDPNEPLDFAIRAMLLPENPVTTPAAYISTITPTIYIDTVTDLAQYSTMSGARGQRVSALLPRVDAPGTANNIGDSVSGGGVFGAGLNVSISSFYTLGVSSLTIAPAAQYAHASSLSAAFPSYYSRELILLDGVYMHPAGMDFSMFNGAYIGIPGAVYPDFVYDLAYDANNGYRYASFVYETVLPAPTACQYMYVRLVAPSAVSTIGATRADNNWFPDAAVPSSRMAAMKARMHVKILGIHNPGTYDPFETAWINCWKAQELLTYDDGVYDAGAGAGATVLPGGDVEYRVQVNRRFYSRVYTLVRIGLAQDASIYSDAPLQFGGIQVRYSDAPTGL
jgi:hypothetical protein